jgi:hypothetical protein
MSERLNNPDFVKEITRGIPLADLTRSLRPGKASGAGFVGESEDWLDTVRQDYLTVESLGTTHGAIASGLEGLFSRWHEMLRAGRATGMARDFDEMEMKGWGAKFDMPNPDYVYISPTAQNPGDQHCPWKDNAHGQMAGVIIPKNHSQLEYEVAELTTVLTYDEILEEDEAFPSDDIEEMRAIIERQKAAPFYVPLTGLLPHLIREHYFFEGKGTSFRAEPSILISALKLEGKPILIPNGSWLIDLS